MYTTAAFLFEFCGTGIVFVVDSFGNPFLKLLPRYGLTRSKVHQTKRSTESGLFSVGSLQDPLDTSHRVCEKEVVGHS